MVRDFHLQCYKLLGGDLLKYLFIHLFIQPLNHSSILIHLFIYNNNNYLYYLLSILHINNCFYLFIYLFIHLFATNCF